MGEQTTPPEDYWLPATEVSRRLTVSIGTIYRWIEEGTFPRPARFSGNCVRWRTSWITEWEATRRGVADHAPAREGTQMEAVVRPPAAVTCPPTESKRRSRLRRHVWEPLTTTWEEVADRVFRRDAAWLRGNLPPDFPCPDPEYDLFHVEAVEAWARRRWGVIPDAGGEEQGRAAAQAVLRERLRAKKDVKDVHGRDAAGRGITPSRRRAGRHTP